MAEVLASRPLTFVVRASDGTVVDAFTEEDLLAAHANPGKSWQEAACWAFLAWCDYQRQREYSSSE